MHPFWAPPLALIFSTFGTVLGIYAFILPLSAARQHGFGLPTNADLDFNYIFGGRNIAVGLMMYAFYFQRHFKAMGTVLLCIMFSGVVDAVVSGLSERGMSGGSLTMWLEQWGWGF